jgi:hypothetical protein
VLQELGAVIPAVAMAWRALGLEVELVMLAVSQVFMLW